MAKGKKDVAADRFHKREESDRDYQKQLPGDDEAALPPPVEPIQVDGKPERNAPCSCGSGKKYKKCCGRSAD